MAPQSYYIGGKIRASDFNNFADDINEIVGLGAGDSGYGQDQLMVSYVAAGARIRAANWDELLTSLRFAAQHQGTTISSPTSTSDPGFPTLRETIKIIPTLIDDMANVRANKLNYDISKMSIDANKISSSKTFVDPASAGVDDFSWNGTQTYEFKVTFADEDARRNFFNAGGEIRINCDLSNYDTSHPQSESWSILLANIATVKIGHNLTESTAGEIGGGTRIGFTGLTDTYPEDSIYKKTGTQGYYSGNQINIYAKLNGTDAIDVKVVFYDAYPENSDNTTNAWEGADYVDGTLSVTIDQQRADDNDPSNLGVVSPSPTYSHISEL
jgi:hypothetical protein